MSENEFEKWHKRFDAKDERDRDGHPYHFCHAHIHRMAGWKAALEWVLKITEGTLFPSRNAVEQEMKKPTPEYNEN